MEEIGCENRINKSHFFAYETPQIRLTVVENADVLTESPDVGGEWPDGWNQQ